MKLCKKPNERNIMKRRLYQFLVNRHAGIRDRYHHMHDGASGITKVISWCYLLWLNFCYYILFCRFLDKPGQSAIYEEKRLYLDSSESEMRNRNAYSVTEYVQELSKYDIISFDIFDTLIFRPFSDPTDLFYFLALELGILDFKRIRVEQEYMTRLDCYRQHGHYEVTFQAIWKRIEKEVGISAEKGMELEQKLEETFCYANPFMQEVFHILQKQGKKIIAVSDMYLPADFLSHLLVQNGYTDIWKLYVSCEYEVSKGNGGLYKRVKEELGDTGSIIHIGDNEISDEKMAKKHGFHSLYYPNVNKMAVAHRPYNMSPVIGGAYRGIVDNYLYQGLHSYSMEYEYGFVYGGLFVLGYCHFIHEYCFNHGIAKKLFLSRDGDILKQVYDQMYPGEDTSYVYWSRAAATKLMAEHDRYDYFRRYLYHKVNQEISLKEILKSMELEGLQGSLSNYTDIDDSGEKTKISLSLEDPLTHKNVEALKRYLQLHFDEILEVYGEQKEAAKEYYTNVLSEVDQAVAVDIGWAGSGALSLSYLIEQVWGLPCQISGIIAGTNTIHNAEADASEIFLQSGKLVSYLYSQADNRDIMKKHDCNKDYNVYWELLLSSPTRQFLGFAFEENIPENGERKIKLCFGKEDKNQKGIQDIQRGILDFAEEYRTHFQGFPYMMDISGRDAYAPMLVAASYNERYLKVIEKKFALEINVV